MEAAVADGTDTQATEESMLVAGTAVEAAAEGTVGIPTEPTADGAARDATV